MLRQLLSLNPEANISRAYLSEDLMTILNFGLLPGGFSRDSRSEDPVLNKRFSEIVLESVKLLLHACLLRKQSQAIGEPSSGDSGTGQSELTEIQRLMDFIDEARKSDGIKMGGVFPHLIAQKTVSP